MVELYGDHWAHFGDGNSAQIIDSKDLVKQETGSRKTRFIFRPSKRIEEMYDITEEQDETGAIIQEYSSYEVLWLERGVTRSRCWIKNDFLGGETPATREVRMLTETLKDSDLLLSSAEAAKNRSYEKLRQAQEQSRQWIRQQANIFQEVNKLRGRPESLEGDDVNPDMPE